MQYPGLSFAALFAIEKREERLRMCLAVPGRIVSVTGAGLLRAGKADFSGVLREVCLAYVPEANVGDYVIVHAGVAISVLDVQEAERTLELLHEVLTRRAT